MAGQKPKILGVMSRPYSIRAVLTTARAAGSRRPRPPRRSAAPEIPYDLAKIGACLQARSRRGKRFSILVAAEGAKPVGGELTVARTEALSPDPVRLGGVGQRAARRIEELFKLDTRVTVLGHLQRGGSPLASDRVLCTRFGVKAAELAAAGLFGQMVALRGRTSSACRCGRWRAS